MSRWMSHGWRAGLGLLMLSTPALAAGLGDGSDTTNLQLDTPGAACPLCVPGPSAIPEAPVFMPDWSVALRGSVSSDTTTGATSYSGEIAPTFSITQDTLRGSYSVAGQGALTVGEDGAARLDSLSVTADGRYELDEWSALTGSADLAASQDDPDDGSYASNVKDTPLQLSGTATGGYERKFGQFTLALRGSIGRSVVGETTYDDGTSDDNSYEDATHYGAGGRLTAKLTPVLSAYVDLDASTDLFDKPSPSLLEKLDGQTYALRGGMIYAPDPAFSFEGSVGMARRDFTAPSLTDFDTMLYGGKVVFKPDATLELTGTVSTALEAPGSAADATTKVVTDASLEAAYLVNSWVRLRGSAGWTQTVTKPTDSATTEWTAGLGADYLLNLMTDLTADYSYTSSQTDSAAATGKHEVTLGVTFHR